MENTGVSQWKQLLASFGPIVTLAFGNRDKRSSSMNVCSIRCCFDLPLLWPPLVPLWRGSTSPYSVYFDCTLNVHAKESLDFFEKQQILVQINQHILVKMICLAQSFNIIQ